MRYPIACHSLQITGDKCYTVAFISLVAIKPTNTPKAPGLWGFPFNSLWSSDVIWHQISRSVLAEVMGLMAPSHYLNQCWHITRVAQKYAHDGIIEDSNQLTLKQLETQRSIPSTIAIDALVLQHQAISIHIADQISLALDQFQRWVINLKGTALEYRIAFPKGSRVPGFPFWNLNLWNVEWKCSLVCLT